MNANNKPIEYCVFNDDNLDERLTAPLANFEIGVFKYIKVLCLLLFSLKDSNEVRKLEGEHFFLNISQANNIMKDSWRIGDKTFNSRLIACVASIFFKDKSNEGDSVKKISKEEAIKVLINSETNFLIVNFNDGIENPLNEYTKEGIVVKNYTLLNNTDRAISAEEAIKKSIETANITNSPFMKLEVFDENKELINEEVLIASKELLKNNRYKVMPFITPNLELALKLQNMGCSVLRIQAGKIESKKGIQNKNKIREICQDKRIKIPIILEGGIGTPEHAYEAMLLGADAVLVNTALTTSENPSGDAILFKEAIKKSRKVFLIK